MVGLPLRSQYLPLVATAHNEEVCAYQLKLSSTYFLVAGCQALVGVNAVL